MMKTWIGKEVVFSSLQIINELTKIVFRFHLDKNFSCSCQEYLKNSVLFTQFLSALLTYELLCYFNCLHCANIHIHLPFFFLFLWPQTSNKAQGKTSYFMQSALRCRRYSSNHYSKTLLYSGPSSPSLSQNSKPGGLSTLSCKPASWLSGPLHPSALNSNQSFLWPD